MTDPLPSSDAPPWREWQHMTGPEIDGVDRGRAIVFVTCSPLEVHGPHLPVVTDNAEAEALALRTARRIAARFPELTLLHLPPIYVAADVLPHVGSIAFRSSTITAVMSDLGRSLCKQGFRHIWVSSFHGGPRHFVPIEVAAHRTNQRHGGRMVSMFSLLLNRLTGGSSDLTQVLSACEGVTREQLVGDNHAGVIETSMMLHLLGEHVAATYGELPQKTVDSVLAERGQPPLAHHEGRPDLRSLFRGFKEKLEYYAAHTYAGAPGAASPELGERFLDVLSELAADTLADVWTGAIPLEQCHSPVWKARWLFTSETASWAFERLLDYRSRVF